jgi:hypothetical protein
LCDHCAGHADEVTPLLGRGSQHCVDLVDGRFAGGYALLVAHGDPGGSR